MPEATQTGPTGPARPRTWVVTGGTSGVGRQTAHLAAAGGDRVAVLARQPNDDDDGGDGGGGSITPIACDVGDPAAVEAAVAAVARRWGRIDVLVNNAGLHRGGLVDALALDDWDAVLRTNLGGPVNLVRAALPFMDTGGAIVNIGAVVGLRGFAGDAAYGTSKAGLAGLTRVLAVELAPRGIRVNLVVPGFVSTNMTARISKRARARILQRIPLGREGLAEEIASVIHWVAGATYMTGAVVPVDGGLLCQL